MQHAMSLWFRVNLIQYEIMRQCTVVYDKTGSTVVALPMAVRIKIKYIVSTDTALYKAESRHHQSHIVLPPQFVPTMLGLSFTA
jgi:hypothetical protein